MYALLAALIIAQPAPPPKDWTTGPTFTLKWIADAADEFKVDDDNELATKEASREFQAAIRKELVGKEIKWTFSVEKVAADGIPRIHFFPGQYGNRRLWFRVAGSVDCQTNGPNMPISDAHRKWAVKLQKGSAVTIKGKIKSVVFLTDGDGSEFSPRLLRRAIVVLDDRWEAYPYRRR